MDVFFSLIYPFSSSSPSLVDGLVKAEILFQRAVKPKTTNERSNPQLPRRSKPAQEKCG